MDGNLGGVGSTDSLAGDQSVNSVPVFDRLSKTNQKQQMVFVMSQLKDELEMSQCTFHPAVRGTLAVGGTAVAR